MRIGAIHALAGSVGPTDAALETQWPGTDVAHLLDGSLYLDRSRGTADETELASRIDRLIRYSAATGAQGILFTGSFFGAAVHAAKAHVTVPVLTSFEGLVDRALAVGRPLHVISTAADSVTLLSAELHRVAAERQVELSVTGEAVTHALDALLAGNPDEHDHALVDTVRGVDPSVAVVMAQFSMERALSACAEVTTAPVIGPATEAVKRLRRVLTPHVTSGQRSEFL